MIKKTRLPVVLLIFSIFLTAFAGFSQTASAEVNLRYVAEYYGIEFADEITVRAFEEALGIEDGENGEELISYSRAAVMTVVAADMEELALTYSPEKINAVFKALDFEPDTDDHSVNYLAAAIDLGLADPKKIISNEKLAPADAANLVVAARSVTGGARNYLGRTDDSDIYGKLAFAFKNHLMPSNEELIQLGNKAVMEKITTGYNVRDNRFKSNFESELSICYGHSNLKHALQLVGLLRSEGISALVNIEPKVSAYEYLLDWGPVPDPFPTYFVLEEGEDFYIAYAFEYDLLFEFANKEDRDRFDEIVVAYAKKNTGEEGKALIAGAWWQPFYFSVLQLGDNYAKVSNNVVDFGIYSLHTSSLDENSEKIQTWLAAEIRNNRDFSLKVEDQYVNMAFYRYLNGESE